MRDGANINTSEDNKDPLEKRIVQCITLWLLPFMFFLCIVAYLDRINAGFAALEMNAELNLSHMVFGIGGGIFLSLFPL
jgi:ACS family tartrate transporter-like MFS transporter